MHIITKKIARIFLIIILFLSIGSHITCYSSNPTIPFSTDSTQLTVWNGKEYTPVFLKGMNLGIAKPGTFPGELLATNEQYQRWFTDIKEAGFNCIRIYTLHYPTFYEELRKYNLAHKQHPLYFFQGVWLNEDMIGYTNDLYQFTDTFKAEIRENIDCVHGHNTINQRFGKAYGTYTNDVSEWNLGYIIGRETFPGEVITTNRNHSGITDFTGTHFGISGGSATEVWWVKNIDFLAEYEAQSYNTERPISVSSWPTLDPIKHPSEPNRDEDTASVDLSKVRIINAPAGFFISYHAYPYYPDFVSRDPDYEKYSDNYGPNSYLGYLTDLKKHYPKYPLIIAEYGVPSSWGVAHYASSGMNHGGFDELNQGITDIRILKTMKAANTGGGMQFSWMDEWFKRTWITDDIDFLNRTLWHNITAAEQNFGLIKFTKPDNFKIWKTFNDTDAISNIKAQANYDFFQLEVGLKVPMDVLSDCWIAFDTYDSLLGESILPNGKSILPYRAEFALHITQYSAQLYVTEAYDLFGIYHKTTTDKQVFQSIKTDNAPWQLVRWKNNTGNSDVQYIGDLSMSRSIQPQTSKDAVIISDNKIKINMPWSLLQMVDPSQMRVFHADKTSAVHATRVSDGIAVSISYKDKLYKPDYRFTWPLWNVVNDSDVVETKKTSYWTMYDQLVNFNSPAIAFPDSFMVSLIASPLRVPATEGVLSNDFDLDGTAVLAVLVDEPSNGTVKLNADGSFTYTPNNDFLGNDQFSYCVFDGQSLSNTSTVKLLVTSVTKTKGEIQSSTQIKIFPNPAMDYLLVESNQLISKISVFDSSGKIIAQHAINSRTYNLNVSNYKTGLYYLVSEIDGRAHASKFTVK